MRGFAQDAEVAELNIISFAVDPACSGTGAPAKEKESIAARYCGSVNARRACFLLFSVLSTENNKIDKLCVLCGSAVNNKL